MNPLRTSSAIRMVTPVTIQSIKERMK